MNPRMKHFHPAGNGAASGTLIGWLLLCFFGTLFPTRAQDAPKIIGRASICCVYIHKTQTQDVNGASATDSTVAILEVGEDLAKYGDLSAYGGHLPTGHSFGYAADDPRANDNFAIHQLLQPGKTIGKDI